MHLDREYLLVNNYDKLGQFSVHYGSIYDHPNYSCLRPVLKYSILEKDAQLLKVSFTPGFLGVDKIFYECPFSVFYCQLEKVFETEESSEHSGSKKLTMDVSLKVFDKTFKDHQTLKGQFVGHDRNRVDIMKMNTIINLINHYVNSGNDIKKINPEKLFSKSLQGHDRDFLLTQINALEFAFFSNDQNRVGKDNNFWEEIEIRNLPNDPFLRELVCNSLKKIKVVDSFQDKQDFALVKYGNSSGYCPADGRKAIDVDIHMRDLVKDHLKLIMVADYDPQADLFQQIQF